MKKQIVKVDDYYAARIKKWWHIRWRYIGVYYTYININLYCLDVTEKDAKFRLNIYLKDIDVIENY